MPARPSVTKLSPARRAAWRCSSTRGEITGSARARMDGAALSAGAQRVARIKALEERRQVAHDALQLHFHAVQEVVALLAVPLEAVLTPSGRVRSITRQTLPASGRCGEWRRCGGIRKIAPSFSSNRPGFPFSMISRWALPFTW